MNDVLVEVRENLDKIIKTLAEYEVLSKIREEERILAAKTKKVEELVKKKAEIDERTKVLLAKERTMERKEVEFRDRKLMLDKREDVLAQKATRVNKILQE